ncbi:MAG: glycosyltransferase family 4 protein [Alicyclobacillus sp.]|nr:glycosyltransferase family 4 protein [Alicyclobacillus sp.]
MRVSLGQMQLARSVGGLRVHETPPAVCIVVPGNERGGAATHLTAFAQAVAAAGQLSRFRFYALGGGPLADSLTQLGLPLECWPASPRSVWPLLLHTQRSTPGHVLWHAHGPRLNVLLGSAAMRTGRPWTSTLHSNPWTDFLTSRWKTLVLPRVNVWFLRRTRGVFVGHPSFAKVLPGHPAYWVPNALTLEPWGQDRQEACAALRADLRIPRQARVIGTIARLDPVKGLAVAMQAMAQLPSDCHWVLLGDGPQRTELQRLANHLGIADRVHFLGFLDDVRPVIAGLDVHLLPSLSEGGSPFAVLETGFYGVPNVCSDIPSLRGLIRHGETGRLFPVGNVHKLVEELQWLLAHPQAAEDLGLAFQAYVRSHFTLQRMWQAYADGYRHMGVEWPGAAAP